MSSSLQQARYAQENSPETAPGWQLHRVTPPSRLFGANGLRTGPDGRIYIAQVTGSQISALDLDSGAIEAVSPKGGDIIAPDDLAFDDAGNLYATEYYDGRISVREPSGRTRVLRDDLPAANGITVHRGRLFVNECRQGGRLMELDLAGGAPRVLAENLAGPNAMEVGPDGLLYFPQMMANEIWRIHPDGGEPERVAAELGAPDAVKFDADGFIISTQVASGQVLRIDPRSGTQTVLAQLNPGLDNLTIADGRLFASNFTGEITEVLSGGGTRALLPGGLNWPHDLAIGDDGRLYVADGTYFYALQPDGSLETVAMLFTPGYPGYLRGLAAAGGGDFLVTTSLGQVGRYRPGGETDYLAAGFDRLYGIAVDSDGTAVFAELGAGRVHSLRAGRTEVLATDLQEPAGVAFDLDGAPVVTESAAGRIVRLTGGRAETVLDGLGCPQGILVDGTTAYVVDAGAKEVVAVDLTTGTRETIAGELPIGAPPGVEPKPLRGIQPFSGPQGPFAGITRAPDGTLFVSADGDGSVLALRRT
ncbi:MULTISPECIES: SMP-30/gluconolactonase/LRE family protein [Mycobacteriaceae]|uniref:Vgb family protein n=1 Tax=Mycobacteriaceae TaxID=1762 RepID=UPI000800A48E|nr:MULTISPECIES: SMP-30/gluconolactonase/LRE family protein [Mycobacteriaceae]MCK0172724.1 SMP-30/gluconolactonase/LRE family protein [Mycolicibacterium sp. F2034L]OBB61888.1 gluconolaconase [Mycobacterium sp. 852013-51886_SCH5428379]